MAEKIFSDVGDSTSEGSIVLVLTVEEFELFRDACLELLNFYEINRRKTKKVVRILEKLEDNRKEKKWM